MWPWQRGAKLSGFRISSDYWVEIATFRLPPSPRLRRDELAYKPPGPFYFSHRVRRERIGHELHELSQSFFSWLGVLQISISCH